MSSNIAFLKRASVQNAISQTLINAVLLVIGTACIIPLMVIVSASFTEEKSLARLGYSIFPHQFSLDAYRYIFSDPKQLINAYIVTSLVTVAGTFLSVLIMAMLAYSMSRKSFSLRRPLAFYVFFTMLFNGGLVPFYILVTQYLHLRDTFWVMVLPYMVTAWNVLLLRTYFSSLPEEIIDAARIDGANEYQIFFNIAIPLSTPALATVALFVSLMYWNDWWMALLFIDSPHLIPLQSLLQRLLTNAEFIPPNPFTQGMPTPVQTIRMAMATLAVGPIAFIFLFIQKYFARGLTLGSLKD